MNPFAYTDLKEKETSAYVEKTDLPYLMVSGAITVLCLCVAFAVITTTLTLLRMIYEQGMG